jgi:hypothetical protein
LPLLGPPHYSACAGHYDRDPRGATQVRRYVQARAQIARAVCLLSLSTAAYAQSAPPILPVGDAAVAGFSGTTVVGSPPPPALIDKTYINLDGPALRVIGLSRMGGAPQAQLVAAPKTFTVIARQIGQVFSLAVDDANPPNIYAAASSAYGLPIVVPDADGDGVPDRSRRGAPNAAFMPGLFGPITIDGGPGSIWKIDGRTGAVTLFANVVLRGVPNSGPALGALAFDPASRQLFVADRDTGMIHRFTLDGVDRGQFDHGTQTLSAVGLPPIAFDPRKRLNIESPAFDSGNPGTWAYAPPARRVFGLAVSRGRLYYAVAAGLRVWSVSLLPDGSFGPDPRFELTVPRTASPSAEISEILFDDSGDMLVAERGAPTGAYDYKALAESPENRVLRFRPKRPDDPPSRDLWFPVPREYAIGFPPNFRNDNGGIALGYGYDDAGNINRAVCGGTLWSTGEQLRNARDSAIIRRLQPGGPLIVDGLQGNAVPLLRPQNEPPFATYFIDYDDRFDDPQTRGHLGDVVIPRVCGQAALPLVPVVLICPLGLFNVDGVCRFPLTCPSGTEFSNGCCGYRDCPASYVRIRGRCVPPPTNCKPGEVLTEGGRCEAPKCPPGMVFVNSDAAAGSGPGGLTAPSSALTPGALNALEEALKKGGGRDKPKMCSGGGYCKCPEGTQRSEDGTCKKSSGCGPNMVLSDGECTCANGYVYATDWKTCVPTSVCDPGTPGGNTAGCCRPGRQWSQASLSCDPPPRCDPSDPTSLVQNNGQCVCRDGSSAGQSGGFSSAAGLTGQNCCPTGRRFNPVTNKCDPDNVGNPNPRLRIVKTLIACFWPVNAPPQCAFKITISNEGPGTYTGQISFTDKSTGNPTFADPRPPQGWTCTRGSLPITCNSAPGATLAPGDPPIVVDVVVLYPPGASVVNCAALGSAEPVSSGVSSNDVSCVPGQVPNPPAQPPRPPPPPTITVTCPLGTVLMNNQCFFVDPGCRGPDCRPVVVGCANGGQRNSDGNCPTPTTTGCTGGKTFDDGACRCPYPMTENSAGQCAGQTTQCTGGKIYVGEGSCACPQGQVDDGGKCVRIGTQACPGGTHRVGANCVPNTTKSKKTRTRQPTEDTKPSGPSSPQLNIQIGPGFPGGGGGGGRNRTPTPTKPPRNPSLG